MFVSSSLRSVSKHFCSISESSRAWSTPVSPGEGGRLLLGNRYSNSLRMESSRSCESSGEGLLQNALAEVSGLQAGLFAGDGVFAIEDSS
jgi:hypothetical protein